MGYIESRHPVAITFQIFKIYQSADGPANELAQLAETVLIVQALHTLFAQYRRLKKISIL